MGFFDVDGEDMKLSFKFVGNLLDFWSQRFAWLAPGCRKVDEYGLFRILEGCFVLWFDILLPRLEMLV